ncbi:MAG: hypothetical protein UY22_C0050G0014 [Candidatus Amesbacteria bacterium GW2011_GWC1_48_10]|uniref:Uncharacterized protein n=1 Tax=Candidatus Amesbacteria bacterium GW2011_GWC1_48_10 TaxID=1618365 RepID=A0A0G1U9I9_9BACT|nr:MAG: hypothetical protein UY22_C0050G0014 [Candidatus Amesbacteria bacterium GW2011_GWC1_48_10]
MLNKLGDSGSVLSCQIGLGGGGISQEKVGLGVGEAICVFVGVGLHGFEKVIVSGFTLITGCGFEGSLEVNFGRVSTRAEVDSGNYE